MCADILALTRSCCHQREQSSQCSQLVHFAPHCQPLWYRWLSIAGTSSRGKTDGCEVSSSSLMAGGASDRKMLIVHTPACRQKTWGSHQSCPAGGRAGQCPSSLREALCIRSLRSVTTLLLFSVLGLNRATTRVTRGRHGRQHWIQKMKSKDEKNLPETVNTAVQSIRRKTRKQRTKKMKYLFQK